MDRTEALREYNRLGDKLKPDNPFSGDLDIKEAKLRGIYTEEILMARADIQREMINHALGLPEPFPAAPSRLPKYILRFQRRGEFKSSTSFCTTYAASIFMRYVLAETKHIWKSERMIVLRESDLEVVSDELEEIIEYKLRGKEKQWELPEPYLTMAKEIGTGVRQRKPWHKK